jgi:hypothetical protein
MAWYGDDLGTQRVQDAIDYIVRHWTDGGYSWPGPQGWHGNYQAMFTMMKGLEASGIDLIDGIDWFDEVSDTIVATQHPNGSWGPDVWDCWPGVGCDSVLSTAWALLTLQKVAPELVIWVELDIKPQSCPNPFNTKNKGVLPIAILGTEDFDVMTVDPATVLLEGVSPLRWEFKDVSRPVDFREDTCDCTTDTADGYMDLTLKFDHQEVFAALGEVTDREVRILTLTGMTFDSTEIEGKDCIIIIHKGPSKLSPKMANEFSLDNNYPNPFNPVTQISYTLPEDGPVKLEIYNLLGQKVATLVDEYQQAGQKTVNWEAKDFSSGVYFYKLTTDKFTATKKMVLIK